MKVALVYDWINTFGGAERILLELYHLLPEAVLFTSVYDKRNTSWANQFKINTSFLQKIPFFRSHHEILPLFIPIAFESFDFSGFDLVITVTSAFAKGVITKPETLHICYLLTPPRYLWSHYQFYLKNRFIRWLSWPLINYLRQWDSIVQKRPDYLIAISQTVRQRVKKFYQRDCEVIYPPVLVDKFVNKAKSEKQADYFLVVGRLVPYKRIDLAIQACNRLKKPLIVVGQGRSELALKAMAGSNVKFLKNLTDEQLISYYQKCRALILPSEEDFGIVAVEAQASGKPVIAYGQGGSRETVKNGVTGLLFRQQTVESLIEAIKQFEKMSFSVKKCQENSKKFTNTLFRLKFKQKIQEYLSNKGL